MRLLVWTILLIAVSGTPARAQTYAPGYPVCIQTYGIDGGYIDCSFTSIGQCQASASGRAAQCISNPYFAGTSPVRRRYRDY